MVTGKIDEELETEDLRKSFEVYMNNYKTYINNELKNIEEKGYNLNEFIPKILAYDICENVYNLIADFKLRIKSQSIVIEYILAAERVYEKYYKDHPYILNGKTIFEDLRKISSKFFKDQPATVNQEYQTILKEKNIEALKVVRYYNWRENDIELSLTSIIDAQSTNKFFYIINCCTELVKKFKTIVLGIDKFVETIEKYSNKTNQTQVEREFVILHAVWRTIEILSNSNIPFHPIRYQALQILQSAYNTHRFQHNIGSLWLSYANTKLENNESQFGIDPVAADAAKSELIALIVAIDDKYYNELFGSNNIYSRAVAITSSHFSIYPSSNSIEEMVEVIKKKDLNKLEQLILEINLNFQKLQNHFHLEKIFPTGSGSKLLSEFNISTRELSVVHRIIAELYCLNNLYQESIDRIFEYLTICVEMLSDQEASTNCKDKIINFDVALGIPISILRFAKENNIYLNDTKLRDAVYLLSIIRDIARDDKFVSSLITHNTLQEKTVNVNFMIYFRVINYFWAWNTLQVRRNNLFGPNKESDEFNALFNALVTNNLNDEDRRAELSCAINNYASKALSFYEPQYTKKFAIYVCFTYQSSHHKYGFEEIDYAAVIDRYISDFRGIILGLENAESRGELIRPTPGDGGEEIIERIPLSLLPDDFDFSDQKAVNENVGIPFKANRLFNKLFPNTSILESEIIHIIPDGDLFRLPFNTIIKLQYTNKQDFPFITKCYSFAHLLSIYTKLAYGSNDYGIIITEPDYNLNNEYESSLEYLEFSKVESQSIIQSVNSICVSGKEANKENVLKMNNPRFIHFITHMMFEDDSKILNDDDAFRLGRYSISTNISNQSCNSAIALSGAARFLHKISVKDIYGNGVLTGIDIRNMDLKSTKFVFLAGCQSTLSLADHNLQYQSLGYDFIISGVDFVIGSVLPLDDAISPIFVSEFYLSLSKNEHSHIAFSKAITKARSVSSQCYQWGGYDYIGHPNILI